MEYELQQNIDQNYPRLSKKSYSTQDFKGSYNYKNANYINAFQKIPNYSNNNDFTSNLSNNTMSNTIPNIAVYEQNQPPPIIKETHIDDEDENSDNFVEQISKIYIIDYPVPRDQEKTFFIFLC